MKTRSDKFIVRLIIGLAATFLSLFILSNFMVITQGKNIINDASEIESKLVGIRVGIVFGGGITLDLKPSDVVQSRLDAAIELYNSGAIDKLLVSGDNRFIDYNEPQAMQDYLLERGVPSYDIQQDNAGRSTYETCERAKKIFQLNEAVLISQNSHLPRAIFLCRSFGVQAYGYPSTNQHLRVSQSIRELGANVKAVFNVYVLGEKTVLGTPINF